MKTRILSVLFIVALLVAALMITAQAETPATCPCGCGKSLTAITWTEWSGTITPSVTAGGHYKLTGKTTFSNQLKTNVSFVLDLNGNTLTVGKAARAFYVQSGATVDVFSSTNPGGADTRITGRATSTGTSIYINGGTVNLHEGGNVTGYITSAANNGGTIVVNNSGTLNAKGGNVSAVSTTSGGAIYVYGNSTCNITSGTIGAGTVANQAGGAVYSAGTLHIGGDAKITTRNAAKNANVFLTGTATFKLSGRPEINGIEMPNANATFTVDTLEDGANIILDTFPIAVDEANASLTDYVAKGYINAYTPGMVLSVAADNKTISSAYYDCPCCTTEPAEIVWTPWVGSGGQPVAGTHYYVTEDASWTSQTLAVAGEYTLNLNGHTLQTSTSTRFAAFTSGMTLNIVDSGVNGTISTSYGTGNGALFNVTAGTLKLYDGTFRQTNANFGASTGEGAIAQCATNGTIYVLGDAVLDASAVTSTNATRSPLVCKKTAYIQGGTILANAAGNSVYVTTAATSLSVSGGDIRGDLAVAKSGTVTLSGAPTVSEVRFASAGLTVNIENLTTGASIGVNASGAFTAAANNDAAAWVEAGYLTSNVSGKSVVAREGILYIEEVATPVRCPHCGEDVQWTPWEKQTESGHYYLTAGYSSSQYVTAADTDIVLDLRGNWYTSADARSFVIKDGATFSLVNTSETASAVSGGHSSGPVEVQADSTFTLYPGITCKQPAGSENTMAITAKGGTVVFAEDVDMSVLNGKIKNIGGYLEGIEGALLMDEQNTNGGIWYQTAQEAADLFVDANNDFIRLMGAATVKVTQPGTFFNINGHNLAVDPASTVPAKVANMKSTVTAVDPATVTADEGDIQLVTPYTAKVQYVALSNGQGAYTVHRLELQLSYVTFRPSAFGFYYKATFNTDDILASKVTGYGVALSLAGVPDASVTTKTELTDFAAARGTDVKFGGVFGIMKKSNSAAVNVENGMMKVYANCYVKIGDLVILSDNSNVGKTADDVGFSGVGKSLFDVMQALNGMTLEGEQLEAVNAFRTTMESEMGVAWPEAGDTALSTIPLA